MRIILGLIFLAFLATGAQAKCDPEYAPYYMRPEVNAGPGSILADIFFLPFTVAIATAGAPAEVARPKRRTRGGAELTHGPGCMVGFLLRHAAEQRPVHVEHYRHD